MSMSSRRRVLAICVSVVAMLALGISAYLTYVTWSSGVVAGCSAGAELDCEDVLGSHWSKWLGLPVSLLGVIAYVGILVLAWVAALKPGSFAETGLVTAALLAVGAGVWFTALQIVNLDSYCFYCLTVHLCGIFVCVLAILLARDESCPLDASSMRTALGVPQGGAGAGIALPGVSAAGPNWLAAFGTAAIGVAALVGGQVLAEDESIGIEEVAFNPPAVATSDDTQKESAGGPEDGGSEDNEANAPDFLNSDYKPDLASQSSSREISFAGLSKSLDVKSMPMMGDPTAEHVFVEFVDYTCKHCRKLHPHVMAAKEKYGDDLAVVIHHVPLNKKCNPNVKGSHPLKVYSCDYTQLAIKVWLIAPERFAEYHDWMMTGRKPPSVFEARKRALSLVGGGNFLDPKLDKKVGERISIQCDNFQTFETGLPIMLFRNGVRRGVPKKSEDLFKLLESEFDI